MESENNEVKTYDNEEEISNNDISEFNGEFHEKDSQKENNIVDEVKTSFIDYSVSVITSRALPDLRDGLKPVHRRILWSMYKSGYTPDKPHRKSAKTVGEVMGNYHPHGDSSIYEAMVRLAQDFNERYMLIDGHGNFGNIEGDGAAAMRYTESRLSKISLELLRDINKNTVDMVKNFDESLDEPSVLPSRFPNILVNGTMGIAVGMATNIPPHNLAEVIDGCIAYIDNPDIDTNGLMQFIKGPDFPTGGLILGNSGIKKAYETGRGSITIRSKAEIIENGNHNQIIITEVPYGTNTYELKNKVAELVHNKIIDGIADYHTDLKDGVKITITLKKDANAQVVLNKLYKLTNFQISYGIIFLMIDDRTPKTLPLKDIIAKYIDHQREVIIRRTKYDLNKAEERVHILEGLKIALDNIDAVIKLIRGSKTDEEAKTGLMENFKLDEIQANAILEMRLRRLTGLEREKIENELAELLELIAELKSILASNEKVLEIIKNELKEIRDKYADDRRTKIDMTAIDYIDDESLIPNENILITLTHNNYVKRVDSSTYKIQHRGGVGVKGMSTNEEDYVEQMFNLSSHDYILFFSKKGRVYRLKGYEIPEFSRTSKGIPIVNLLQLDKDDNISTTLVIEKENLNKYLCLATKKGLIKKCRIEDFSNIRKSGKIAIMLKDGDELISVKKTSGDGEIFMCSSLGRMVRFNETEVRVMGRLASGVKGLNTGTGYCVGMETSDSIGKILVITENGYGKKTNINEYRKTKRGSKGVKTLNVTSKNGNIVSFKIIDESDNLVIVSNNGMVIRIESQSVSTMSRSTQGVKLINIKDDNIVAAVSVIKADLVETLEDEEN